MELLVGALAVVLMVLIVLFAKMAMCARHAGRHLIQMAARIDQLDKRVAQLEAERERERVEKRLPPQADHRGRRFGVLRGGGSTGAGALLLAAAPWVRDAVTAPAAATVALAAGSATMLYADLPHPNVEALPEAKPAIAEPAPVVPSAIPTPSTPETADVSNDVGSATASETNAGAEKGEEEKDDGLEEDPVAAETARPASGTQPTPDGGEPASAESPPAQPTAPPQDDGEQAPQPEADRKPLVGPPSDLPSERTDREPSHPGRVPGGAGPPGLVGKTPPGHSKK